MIPSLLGGINRSMAKKAVFICNKVICFIRVINCKIAWNLYILWKEEKLSHKRTLCNITEKENEENQEEKRENKLHNRRRQFPIGAPRH